MKKYLYQFMVALFAISSFTLVACSDDDDDPTNNNGGNNTIEINGTKYNVSTDLGSFKFENTACPTVGDDVAHSNGFSLNSINRRF